MAQSMIRAAFYRGGTSRGVFFRTRTLAGYDIPARDRILCAASSPDPDGRQIDGLGGGISSLSKAAVVGKPGEGHSIVQATGEPFPGVEWADDVERAQDEKDGWDVVYRFGQVPVNDTNVDWGSTCGNLVAAVGQFAIDGQVIPRDRIAAYVSSQAGRDVLSASAPHRILPYPVRILAADSGKRVLARVPIELLPKAVWSNRLGELHDPTQKTLQWVAAARGDAAIAGVPGTSAGIVIENPLEGGDLLTGRQVDTIEVDGEKIECTIIDAGLPVIFISSSSLGLSPSQLTSHPATLDSDPSLMSRIESIRYTASRLTPALSARFSPPAPKVCIVAPRADYTTTGEQSIQARDMDVVIRAVSVGNIHRTIPATTLSALAVSLAYEDSIVSRAIRTGRAEHDGTPKASVEAQGEAENVRAITVGQPAGLSTACVKLDAGGKPVAIVYTRTARKIMEGRVLVPNDIQLSSKFHELRASTKARTEALGESDSKNPHPHPRSGSGSGSGSRPKRSDDFVVRARVDAKVARARMGRVEGGNGWVEGSRLNRGR